MLALPVHAIPGLVVQPAELLALPLLALAALRLSNLRAGLVWTSVDTGVAAWLAAVVAATATWIVREGTFDAALLRDVATTLYLAILYSAIRVVADEQLVGQASSALVCAAALAATLGVIGFVSSELGLPTPLALAADAPYPYLGSAARARALTATPNMLASLVMLALLLLAAGAVQRLGSVPRRLAAGVLTLGFALTFSKTVVPLATGLAVVWVLRRERSRLAQVGVAASWLTAALVFGVASHVVVLCEDAGRARLEQTEFIAGEPWLRLDLGGRACAVHATNYAFNKRASLIAIERSWPLGIGPGRHPAFVGRLKQEGLYPEALWLAVPHSSYTGSLAELGLPGVMGLAGFLGGLALGVRSALQRDATRALGVAAAAALAALLIEAIATDVMHFRHYWWLAAVVGSAATRSRA